MRQRLSHSITAVLALAAWAAPMIGHAEDDILKKAINAPGVTNWEIHGVDDRNIVDDPTVAGGKALRMVIPGQGQNPWDIVAQNTVKGRINKGDQLYGAVWIHAVKTENGAPGRVTIRLQEAAAPYGGLAQTSFEVKGGWELYTVTTIAGASYPAGATNIAVHLATSKQTIDLGPVFVIDTGPPSH